MNIVYISFLILFTGAWILYRVHANNKKKDWTAVCSLRSYNRFKKVSYYVPKTIVDEDNIKTVQEKSLINESQAGSYNSIQELHNRDRLQPLEIL